MVSGFSFDQKAPDSVVNDAIKDVTKDAEKRLDRVHRQYAGKSPSVRSSQRCAGRCRELRLTPIGTS